MASTSEVLALERGKHDAETVDTSTAYVTLRKNIYSFLQRKGDRLGIDLLEFNEAGDVFIFDGPRKLRVSSISGRELKTAIMQDFGAKEDGKKPRRRTDVDPRTYREIPTSYTEYRRFKTPTEGLVFKTVEEFKDGVFKKGLLTIDEIHEGPIIKSSLPPKQSR
jgi:hypothetical protein